MTMEDQALAVQMYVPINFKIIHLYQTFPFDDVKASLQSAGKFSKRYRAFPAEVVVYYVITLALFTHLNLREVLRCLLENLRHISNIKTARIISKSAISKARTQLSYEPLKFLYDNCVIPIANSTTQGAWYKNWRLVSLDGSTLDLPDEKSNRETFGVPTTFNDLSPFPQIRFVTLAEIGTHVLFGAEMADYKTGEITLAKLVVAKLEAGMLCLADRGFFSYSLWKQALSTGAELLWRARKDIHLMVEEILPDGSYLSRLSNYFMKRKNESLLVRVIVYQVNGIPNKHKEIYRLVTTILCPQIAPAKELAALYQQRWEIEGAFDELKTHLRGKKACLRSKTPLLVKQEFYSLLLAHFAIRHLMHEAAIKINDDPDKLSFTHTLNILRRKIINPNINSPRRKKF